MDPMYTHGSVIDEVVPLEEVIDCGSRGRWQYVSVRGRRNGNLFRHQRYLHVDCDALTTLASGRCVACGAPSPSSSDW